VSEPVWVRPEIVLAIHDEQIAEYGGSAAVRDQGLLSSALARPQNLHAGGRPTLADLAAAYAFGVAHDRPFADGNKRTALVVTELFLALNGVELVAPDFECAGAFLVLAIGGRSERDLAAWIADNSRKRG
jgi:death-on-curing protein